MRRRAHTIGALIFGAIGYSIWHFLRSAFFLPVDPSVFSSFTAILNMDLKIFFIFIGSSFLGATLPDILDPPFSSRHRAFAHSKILLYLFMILWVLSLYIILTTQTLSMWSVYFFLSGYVSHLVLDSMTPAGLR